MALGKTEINLQVDLFSANVPVIVVSHTLQTMPVLIGQTFLDSTGAVLIIRNGKLRIFNNEMTTLPEIDQLPVSTIKLLCQKAIVIPPNHIGMLSCFPSEEYAGDIFVDIRQSFTPRGEYVIPRCVTSTTSGIVPYFNASDEPKSFDENQLIVGGVPCVPDVGNERTSEVSINTLSKKVLSKFTFSDIQKQVNTDIGKQNMHTLLNTLNDYRDCFAQDIGELGCIKGVEMEIILTDDKPVTYRPYLLSFQERQKVQEMVDNLLDSGIIQESHSPYASPVVLVKKKNKEPGL